jgi:hypothetical protein
LFQKTVISQYQDRLGTNMMRKTPGVFAGIY